MRKTAAKRFYPPSVQAKREAQKLGSANYQRAKRIRSSQRWRDLRDLYLSQFPVCQWCGKHPAVEVHHIELVSHAPEKAFDEDNLFSVSERCHELIHARMRESEKVIEDIRRIKDDGR